MLLLLLHHRLLMLLDHTLHHSRIHGSLPTSSRLHPSQQYLPIPLLPLLPLILRTLFCRRSCRGLLLLRSLLINYPLLLGLLGFDLVNHLPFLKGGFEGSPGCAIVGASSRGGSPASNRCRLVPLVHDKQESLFLRGLGFICSKLCSSPLPSLGLGRRGIVCRMSKGV